MIATTDKGETPTSEQSLRLRPNSHLSVVAITISEKK